MKQATLTARELVNIVGGHGSLSVDALSVRVRVDDVRQAFGRLDYLVTPVAGSGRQWVSADRVKLDALDG